MEKQIEGTVDSVLFHNERSGFTVVKIKLEFGAAPEAATGSFVHVVGTMFKLDCGESLRFEGDWERDYKYGWQFQADKLTPIDPRSIDGIRDYLAGDSFKGIGKARALTIARHFGSETIRILDSDPSRIHEVARIPASAAEKLAEDWHHIRIKRAMMTYVQGLGISASIAQKIFNKYGARTKEHIERNPFLLDEELIYEIGFEAVDQMARNRGGKQLDKYRLWAGLEHSLELLAREGHTCAPESVLIDKANKLLAVDAAHLQQTIRLQLMTQDLIQAEILDERMAVRNPVLYLPEYFASECGVALRLFELRACGSKIFEYFSRQDLHSLMRRLSADKGANLVPEQEAAVRMALQNKLSVLTGGPGTGKTTAMRMLICVLIESKHRFALAAPTGRAAKRLSEATEEEASTIHRLLTYAPETDDFKHNEANPLKFDMVIIDEASMLDLELFHSLLKALSPFTHIVLVGDPYQLPSVGAGNVLPDVINSSIAAVTELTQIHRQDEGSQIAENAQLIKQGISPRMGNGASDGFYLFGIPTPQKVADHIVELATTKIPKMFGFDPLRDVQVLAPMHAGPAGIQNLNQRIRDALQGGKGKEFVHIGGRLFRVGDKVMETRNNYEKGVFNGDIGFVESIDHDCKQLDIWMDDEVVTYEFSEAYSLTHAYCISIHKSQGSEYPAVVLPVMTQHGRMLQRSLLYTAVSRAKELVVLVGSRQAIWKAVDNKSIDTRYSGLEARLRRLVNLLSERAESGHT